MNMFSAEDGALRVMTFNIWGVCHAGMTISNRDDNEAAILLRYLPDVAGFQECSPKMRAEEHNILELVSTEYDEVPVEPTNAKKNNYTPVIYRREKVALLDFGWHYYAGLNDAGSKTVTWGFFEMKSSGRRFLFFNTHFFWQSTDAGRATRVSNAGELLALMYEVKEKYPDCPAIFAGDLNCKSEDPPIEVLRRFGLTESRYAAKETSPWRSHHAYPQYDAERRCFGNGTHPTDERERSIDHILTFGDIVTERFVTVVDSEALDASDHCPLFADFVI